MKRYIKIVSFGIYVEYLNRLILCLFRQILMSGSPLFQITRECSLRQIERYIGSTWKLWKLTLCSKVSFPITEAILLPQSAMVSSCQCHLFLRRKHLSSLIERILRCGVVLFSTKQNTIMHYLLLYWSLLHISVQTINLLDSNNINFTIMKRLSYSVKEMKISNAVLLGRFKGRK